MFCKDLVAVAAAAIMVTAVSALPADARAKKEKQYRADTTSLDGRTTGRPRTCGYDTFIYDNLGVPTGPYCH
jgi:hypothetical protein